MSLEKITRDVRLQRYYPSVIASAAEFKALAEAENPEFSLLYEAFWKWMANTFVYDLDKEGAKRWEEMLSIVPEAGDSLERRRMRILSVINTQRPYTERRLQEILDANYGEGHAVIDNSDFPTYAIWVSVADQLLLTSGQIRTLLRSLIPANLTIHIRKDMESRIQWRARGMVSTAQEVYIHAGTDFSMDDFKAPQYAGGKVSMRADCRIGG